MGNKLYSTVEEDIKRKIINLEILPNMKLPTEVELIEKYNVSKITLRKALHNLIDEGFLVSKERVGFFVVEPNLSNYILNFSQIQFKTTENQQTRILSCNTIAFDENGNSFIEIIKTTGVGSINVCVEIYNFFYKIASHDFIISEFNEKAINEKIDLFINYAKNKFITIRTVLPNKTIADILDIDDEPVMESIIDYLDEYSRCYAQKKSYYIKESSKVIAYLTRK